MYTPVGQLIPLLLSQAANEDEYILSRLRSAIFDDGIFAVNDFGLNEGDGGLAFAGSLHAYATCAQAGHMEGHLNKVSLSTTTIHIPGHAEAIDQQYIPWIAGNINPLSRRYGATDPQNYTELQPSNLLRHTIY